MCTFCPVCELVGNNLRAPRRAAIRLKERIKIHKVLRVPHPLPELQASIHSTGLGYTNHPVRTLLEPPLAPEPRVWTAGHFVGVCARVLYVFFYTCFL